MALINLLKQVRVSGKIRIKDGLPIEESLPLLVLGDEGNLPYLNSGGRNILSHYDGHFYKIKGVDPHGILTSKVGPSDKNRIIDVTAAYIRLIEMQKSKKPLVYTNRKPFGVLTRQDAEREKEIFKILEDRYGRLGIQTPYRYIGTYSFPDGNVQNLYELQSLDSDFRLEEFNELLVERLEDCSLSELEKRTERIFELYQKILSWEGWNLGFMNVNGLNPTQNSWLPQNYVVSRVDNGYGLFRVDHSSTVVVKGKNIDVVPKEIFSTYLHIPQALIVATNFELITGKHPKEDVPLIQQAYHFQGKPNNWETVYGRHYHPYFAGAFMKGFDEAYKGKYPEPIKEEMFTEHLK